MDDVKRGYEIRSRMMVIPQRDDTMLKRGVL